MLAPGLGFVSLQQSERASEAVGRPLTLVLWLLWCCLCQTHLACTLHHLQAPCIAHMFVMQYTQAMSPLGKHSVSRSNIRATYASSARYNQELYTIHAILAIMQNLPYRPQYFTESVLIREYTLARPLMQTLVECE